MPKGRKRTTTSTHYRLATMEDMETWWKEHEIDVDETNSSHLSKRGWKLIAGGSILALGLSVIVFPLALLAGNSNRAVATTAPAAGIGDNRISSIVDSYETANNNDTVHRQSFTYNLAESNYSSWRNRFRDYQNRAFRDEPDLVDLTVTGPKHSLTLLNYTGSLTEQEEVRNILATFDRFGNVPEYKTVHLEVDLMREPETEQQVVINVVLNQTFANLDASLRRAYMAIPEDTFPTHNYTVNVTISDAPIVIPVTISAEIPDRDTVAEHINSLRTEDTPVKSVADQFSNPENISRITYRLPHKDLPGMLTLDGTGSFNSTYINQFNAFWDTLDAENLPPLVGELRNADESLAYGNWLP